ncbi:uncharacterized protein IWZ02DRAFT_240020 [Phyllosticta citriasiana]|uniref:Uncharacterized protein n=1 Tax=Phyllosticta citriasiana TaxID=595635 RepID=A0ABR1KQG4_9PEZI
MSCSWFCALSSFLDRPQPREKDKGARAWPTLGALGALSTAFNLLGLLCSVPPQAFLIDPTKRKQDEGARAWPALGTLGASSTAFNLLGLLRFVWVGGFLEVSRCVAGLGRLGNGVWLAV